MGGLGAGCRLPDEIYIGVDNYLFTSNAVYLTHLCIVAAHLIRCTGVALVVEVILLAVPIEDSVDGRRRRVRRREDVLADV